MKLKFTRKTWYFLLLASAAASMLNGFAVLSGTSFSLIEQIAFAAAGIAALFLAAEKGSASWEKRNFTGVFVLRKADVGAKIKEYDDIGLAFEDLAAGRTDAVICDDPVAKYYANKRADFAGKFTVAYLHKDPEYYGFCLRKGETELLERLNKAIASMQADGTEAKLKIKWMVAAD